MIEFSTPRKVVTVTFTVDAESEAGVQVTAWHVADGLRHAARVVSGMITVDDIVVQSMVDGPRFVTMGEDEYNALAGTTLPVEVTAVTSRVVEVTTASE